MDAGTIGLAIISSTAFNALVAVIWKDWISERIKRAIQHEYDQKLETHRAQLKAQSETEIVRLKSGLEIAAAERSFRFSHVFEKTAKTIEEIYGDVLKLQAAVHRYTNSSGSEADKDALGAQVMTERTQFYERFLPKRIYVPPETAAKIEGCVKALGTLAASNQRASIIAKTVTGPERKEQLSKKWDEIDKLEAQMPMLLRALENDFQNILGLHTGEASLGESR